MTDKKRRIWILVLVIVAIIIILLFTPFPEIIGLTEPGFCSETPYNDECVCATGFRKISVPWLGIPRWNCEELEKLLIDPESETFEQDAISFVKTYLSRNCGNICTDLSCSGNVCGCPEDKPNCSAFEMTHPIYPNNACISPVFGHGKEGERLVNVECVTITEWNTPQGKLSHEDTIAIYGEQPNEDINPSEGRTPWRMQFFVESETEIPTTLQVHTRSNYCYNSELNKKCTHQSICDLLGNPEWCVGNLPLEIVPSETTLSIFDPSRDLGSGFPEI